MNKKCRSCAKFLTCNQKECKKISFMEAEILEKPMKQDRNSFYTAKQQGKEAENTERKKAIKNANHE